jgi:hypothetical protein
MRDDAKPFTTDFNRFFIGATRIEDAAGHQFELTPVPMSFVYVAGRYHSDSYFADVELDPTRMEVSDSKHLVRTHEIFAC